jgi:uncharacterized membrane protein YccF (DUF307 family)
MASGSRSPCLPIASLDLGGAARLALVRLLGNIIWFVFAGLWLFIGYAFAALLCFILIITIPFGVASLRIALDSVWPFGRAVVPQANKGIGSTLGNVIGSSSPAGG